MGCLKLTYQTPLKVVYRTEESDKKPVQRFISVDPLAAKAPGWTPYRFCFDNPISYTDPDGRFETRKEAKQYKKEHGIEGIVRKDPSGGFNISNKWTGADYHKGTQWEKDNGYTNSDGIVEGNITVANRKSNSPSTVDKVTFTGGLSATAIEETLNNTKSLSALKENKVLVVYNGEVREWSINFRGNQHVPSSLVEAEKLGFLKNSKPILTLSKAANVTGTIFGVIGVTMNVVSVVEDPGNGENWVNLGVGVASLHPVYGWVVFPTYMIMRGAHEHPEAFWGGSEPSLGTGEEKSYSSPICFIAGTKILMSDGTNKNIEDVKIGDNIKSYDFQTKKIESKQVLKVDSPIHYDMVDLTFENGLVNTNTFDHPYFVKNKGWCSYNPELTQLRYGLTTKILSVGDTCYLSDGYSMSEIRIVSITENFEERITYNLSDVQDNHNFFANGILVHNKQIVPLDKIEDFILKVEVLYKESQVEECFEYSNQ